MGGEIRCSFLVQAGEYAGTLRGLGSRPEHDTLVCVYKYINSTRRGFP
jgi:hypothetical protein